jgi:hypothetical protein
MLIPQGREKHLLFLVENKQKQIPRFARDDMVGAFFHRPSRLADRWRKGLALFPCFMAQPQTQNRGLRYRTDTSGRDADAEAGSALRTTMAFPGAGLQDLGNLLEGEVYLLFAVVEVRRKPNPGPGTVVDEDIAY